MNNYLQLKTIDKYLSNIRVCDRPSDGWLPAIRKSLGMSVRQLAKKIGISQQSLSRFEKNELDGVITLNSMRKVAEAMNCKFVYAIVPNDSSLEETIKKQAIKKARELVTPVNHTMILEAQAVGNSEEKINEIANNLAKNLTSKLWE